MSDLPPPPRPRGRKSKSGRERTLSREAIVETALRIVDETGVDGLSMRAVATALGTGPSSLYAHVADKDELLELLLDEVIAEMRLAPAEAPWQEQLKVYVREQHRVLIAHRDLARVTLARVPTGPNAIRLLDDLLGNLDGKLPPKAIGYAIDLLSLFGGASAYEDSLLSARLSPEEIVAYFGAVRDHYAAVPADRYPHLAANIEAMFGDVSADDGDERFEWALDVLVDGIAAYVKRTAGGRGRARSPR
jgi:AcrR family transcriptional regulator